MEDRKPAKLRRLRVTRVDLVDRGANPDAHIALFKRAREPDLDPKQIPGGEPMSDTWLRRTVTAIAKALNIDMSKMAPMLPNEMLEHEKAMNEFWSLKYALSRSLDSIMDATDMEMDKKMAMAGDAIKQFQESCKALMPHVQMEQDMYKVQDFLDDIDAVGSDVLKASEIVKALQQPAAKTPDNTPPINPSVNKKEGEDPMPVTFDEFLNSKSAEERAQVEADLAKRYAPAKIEIPEEVTKRLTALEEVAGQVGDLKKRAVTAETDLKKAQEDLAKEREIRITREYVQKATKYPSAGSVEKVAAMLRKAYEVGEEYGKEIEESFEKAESVVRENQQIFKELGRGGNTSNPASAEAKIAKRAKEMFPDKADAVAEAEFLKTAEGARLYAESLIEQEVR